MTPEEAAKYVGSQVLTGQLTINTRGNPSLLAAQGIQVARALKGPRHGGRQDSPAGIPPTDSFQGQMVATAKVLVDG